MHADGSVSERPGLLLDYDRVVLLQLHGLNLYLTWYISTRSIKTVPLKLTWQTFLTRKIHLLLAQFRNLKDHMKFQWKQPRWLAGARQCLSSHLSRLSWKHNIRIDSDISRFRHSTFLYVTTIKFHHEYSIQTVCKFDTVERYFSGCVFL